MSRSEWFTFLKAAYEKLKGVKLEITRATMLKMLNTNKDRLPLQDLESYLSVSYS